MTAILNRTSPNCLARSARLLLVGASGLALGAPLAANELLFSTSGVRPETGQRIDQRAGLTQIALNGGGLVSIVDAAEYRINADGSIDLYEGAITVASGATGEVVVRMPEGLEGRVAGSGAASNFAVRETGEASGHALSGTVRIGRAGAFERFGAGAMWRADGGGRLRRTLANGVQAQPGAATGDSNPAAPAALASDMSAPPLVLPISGAGGPVAAALNGIPTGFADQLAAAGASSDILAAARRIEAVAGNPVLDTFPSGDLALLVAAAARLEGAYGGTPFPQAEADIIRAYLRFLAGGGAGSAFLASYSRFATDYLDLIRSGGLPSSFAGAGPQDVETYLAYIRRSGAFTALAARDQVLAEAYLAFLGSGGNRDAFARSFKDLTIAYFAFVRRGGDPAAFAGASNATLAQTIAFLRDSGLVVQLGAADRALVQAYLANGGLAFAAQYRGALDDYFAFLASGRRPSEYAALDQTTLRAYLETLADTGLLGTVLGERAGFYGDYLAFLRGGGAIDAFARLPANIFAGYATRLDAYFAFLATGRRPSEYTDTDIATLQAWLLEMKAVGALERFLGDRAAFFAEFAAFVAAGGRFDAFGRLPANIFAGYAADLRAFFDFLVAGGAPSGYTLLTPAAIRAYVAALEAAGATARFLGDLSDFYRDYAIFLAGGGDPDLFAGLPRNPGTGGGTPALASQLTGALFLASFAGGSTTASQANIAVANDGQITDATVNGARVPLTGGPDVAFDQRGWEVRAAGRFGNAVAFTSYLDRDSTLGSNEVFNFVGGVPTRVLPQSGLVSYRLVGGAAPAERGLPSGTQGYFTGNLAVAFGGAMPRVGLDFEVISGGTTFASGTAGGAADPLNGGMSIDSSGRFRGLLAARAVSGTGCTRANSCVSNIEGGLFGDDAAYAGLVYFLNDASDLAAIRLISGSAVFGRSGTALAGLGTRPGPGGGGGGAPVSAPRYSGTVTGLSVVTSRFGIGSTSIASWNNSTVTFGSDGNIATYTNSLGSTAGSGQPLADAAGEAGSIAGSLAWARFLDPANASGPVANTGVHTIVGTPAINLPVSGMVTYRLIGGTRPTTNQGTATPGSFTGSLAVDFATRRVGIDFNVAIADRAWRLATSGGATNPADGGMQIRADGASFFGSPTVTGLNAASCTASCSADLQGMLFGNGAGHAGVVYRVLDGAFLARGTGIFAGPGAAGTPVTGVGMPAAGASGGGAGIPAASLAPGHDWSRWSSGTAGGTRADAQPSGAGLAITAAWPGHAGAPDNAEAADRRAAIRQAERLMGGMISFAGTPGYEP